MKAHHLVDIGPIYQTGPQGVGMELRYRHTVLALALGANFAQFGSRVIISPLVPQIIDTFDVTKALVGLVLTGMWAAYAVVQYPSGLLADRYGERTIILAGLAAIAGAVLLVAASPSFLLFGVFVLLLGAGAGTYTPVASALLSKLFDDMGQALGIHAMGGPSAALVLPVLAAVVATRYGWNTAILLAVVVTVPVVGLWVWRVRPTPPSRPDRPVREGLRLSAIGELLGRPEIAFTVALATLNLFAFQAFLSFLPTFLVEFHGFSTTRASVIFGIGAALSIVAMPALGRLSDRFSRDSLLMVTMTAASIGFVVFLGSDAGVMTLAVGILAFGIGFAWAGPMQGRFADNLDSEERSTGFGLIRSVSALLGSTGSVVTGALAGSLGWPVAYGLVVGVLGIGIVSLLANRTLALGL